MKKIISLLLTMCIMLSFGINYVTAETTTPPAGNTDTLPDVEQEPLTGEGDNATGPIDINATTTSLKYSTVYRWDAATMPYYNCYSYVLGKTDDIYIPGDFSSNKYDNNDSVYVTANIVVDDLKGDLKYNCVKKQTSRPTSTGVWSNVIALRKQTANGLDFHFAKLVNGKWYHKPGSSAVLVFNNAPNNSTPWVLEGYDSNGFFYFKDEKYDSDIIYILYKKQHNLTTKWTGNHKHDGKLHHFEYQNTCSDCGYSGKVWIKRACSGPPCTLPSGIIIGPELY